MSLSLSLQYSWTLPLAETRENAERKSFFRTLSVLYFSFHTSSGNGFEAFFTEEDILVVAVCIKKEFHTLAVADCPISDNEWVYFTK